MGKRKEIKFIYSNGVGFTREHLQRAYDALAKIQSEKYGVDIKYTLTPKEGYEEPPYNEKDSEIS